MTFSKDEKTVMFVLLLVMIVVLLLTETTDGMRGVIFLGMVLLYLIVLLLIGGIRRMRGDIEARYRDQEALLGIYQVLNIEKPLPRLGGYALSPQHASKIVSLNLSRKPEVVVEFGSGVSTLLTAYCMQRNGGGKVVSFENDDFVFKRVL